MGESWFVRPDVRRVPLSDDQWIEVKRRLTAGEYRAHLRRSSTIGADGFRRVDFAEHGVSLVMAYLVDWSLADAPMRGANDADMRAALDTLDPDRFDEIHTAVTAHELAMDAERDAAKKKTATTSGASPISDSPSAAAGALSGSAS